MARHLRIEFPGAFYHVMARGNEKRRIYSDDQDRKKFLDYLESATNRHGVVVHCYCLMDNHYHLMLETPRGNLSQIMHHINSSYTAYFNTRHDRVGHLFQGRYKSILVDADSYCLSLSRYIHLNPAERQEDFSPGEYLWSSYRYYLNEGNKPQWLKTDFVYSLLPVTNNRKREYCRYVESSEDISDERWRPETSVPVLGDDEFLRQAIDSNERLNASCALASQELFKANPEISEVTRLAISKTQNDYRLAKKLTIFLCHQFSSITLKQIGGYFGLSDSAVTKSSTRFASVVANDQRLAEIVASMLAVLRMSNVKERPRV